MEHIIVFNKKFVYTGIVDSNNHSLFTMYQIKISKIPYLLI